MVITQFIFFIRVFFHGHWRLTGQQGKRGNHLLFHSTTSIHSQTFRNLSATLHVRWLSHILNLTLLDCYSMSFTTLSNYYLIDDIWLMMWFNSYLFHWWLDSKFLLQQFDTGNWWTWTRIDCNHPCITTEPTNKVCLSLPKVSQTID